MPKEFKVLIIESESGWGQRVDEVRKFETLEEAKKFVADYNKHNDEKTVPSWYMYAALAD